MKKIAKILYNTAVGFYEDGCSSRAAALTYFTLMSIVPVMAVALGLARGFGFAPILETVVQQQLKEQPEVANYIIDFAYKLLEQTSGGLIAGVGIIILLWSVYNILGSIEEAFNNIWKIPNPRSWVRKITDYIATIIICPLFFVISSSVTIYIRAQLSGEFKKLVFLENVFFQFFPYFVTWMLFTFLYFFLPNRRIPLKYGLIGVLVAGTLYQLLQIFYITVQFKLSSYGTVYGSFAALPLFLIWLNLSWMIILAGAELAYQCEIAAWKNTPLTKDAVHVPTTHAVLALMAVDEIIKTFAEGKESFSLQKLSEICGSSKKDLDDVLMVLIDYNVISETSYASDKETHYQPARDIHSLYLKNIVDLFPTSPNDKVLVSNNENLQKYEQALKHYQDSAKNLDSNILLKSTLQIL